MPGQKYKGVWRSIGKEGVFDFTEYEDVGLSEQVEEHGFDHEAFGEKAFERKKEALHTAMQAQTRARDASAVKGSEASIESMMALVQQLQIGSSSSSASKDKPSATTDARSTSPVKADDGDSTSSDSSSEEAQAGPSAGLSRKRLRLRLPRPRRSRVHPESPERHLRRLRPRRRQRLRSPKETLRFWMRLRLLQALPKKALPQAFFSSMGVQIAH